MLLSIIIPTYNYSAFLKETLDCLLSQSFLDWQAIIVDDGSTDDTNQVIEPYLKDSRFQYYYQQNSGLSAARNAGLRLAQGKYLQFLDADDLISTSKLKLQIAYLEENPSVDICYSQAKYFRSANAAIHFPDIELKGEEWMPKLNGKGIEILPELLKRNFSVVSSPLLRRSLIGSIITFPEDVGNTEDWYFWLSCAFAGAKFHYFSDDKAYTLIRVHANSMSQAKLSMLHGALQLRSWIENKISSSNFPLSEKEVLLSINKTLKNELYTHLMLTGPLRDLKHLSFMSRHSSLKEFISLYKKGIKHQRKIKNQLVP